MDGFQTIQRCIERFIIFGKMQPHIAVYVLMEERRARHRANADFFSQLLTEPDVTVIAKGSPPLTRERQ